MLKATLTTTVALTVAGLGAPGYHSTHAPTATAAPATTARTAGSVSHQVAAATTTTSTAPAKQTAPTKATATHFTRNVVGLSGLRALGVKPAGVEGPYPGDGQGPVARCQQDMFAALGATKVATVVVSGSQAQPGSFAEVAGEFASGGDAWNAEQLAQNWIETCTAWSKDHSLGNPVAFDRNFLPLPTKLSPSGTADGAITWWQVGGTDGAGSPIQDTVAVVRIDNRVALYSTSFDRFRTADGALALAQQVATVLAK